MLESGVDIIEIERIEGAISRHGSRFLERIYTPDEIQQCVGRVASLAARFAAKEAPSRRWALGWDGGRWRSIGREAGSLGSCFTGGQPRSPIVWA